MEVQIKLDYWKMRQDENTKQNVIAGKFNVMVGTQIMASQTFNEGYGSVPLAFSAKLTAKIEDITEEIRKELAVMFTGKEDK